MTERTLVLVKPDGVQRQLVGRILTRYEERGPEFVGLKLVHVSRGARGAALRRPPRQAVLHGPRRLHHLRPARRPRLRGPNAIAVVRAINGATRPHEAAPGTIRGDFALESAQNIVHASDGPEAAADRAGALVRSAGAARYERDVDRWVLAPAGTEPRSPRRGGRSPLESIQPASASMREQAGHPERAISAPARGATLVASHGLGWRRRPARAEDAGRQLDTAVVAAASGRASPMSSSRPQSEERGERRQRDDRRDVGGRPGPGRPRRIRASNAGEPRHPMLATDEPEDHGQ